MKVGRVSSVQVIGGLVFLLAGVLVITNWNEIKQPLLGTCNALFGERMCGEEARHVVGTLLWTLSILPLVLLLELFIPAKKDQPIFSVGLVQDFVWFFSLIFFLSLILTQYSDFVGTFIDTHLSMFRIELIQALPVPVQIIAVVVISDFLGWFDHWVRHKVPFLWEFHKIHHAPRQLNFFSNSRVHPMDYIAIVTVRMPFLLLDLDVAIPTFIGWTLFKEVHLYMIHGNIKTNFGPLRYILTTPQSHRVHHSIEGKHRDKNFAVHFVIWDFLAGTQWRVWDEYPDTGVEDENFPLERTRSLGDLLMTLGRQFIYPFKKLRSTESSA